VGLVARCAEAKFLSFAEEIVKFARSRECMTISMYSALMKVYAYCGLYEKACNLYYQVRDDGLEPDAMMYGCLMRFAVECGKTDLSRHLAEVAPSLDMQKYMSLIRAAGRDGDVERAFNVVQQLKQSGVGVDHAAYNAVLDVCASSGKMDRARVLMQEMRELRMVDVITYNTLLKGYCHAGKLDIAKELLGEMVEVGLQPNEVSYNCILNAAVSGENCNLQEAWDLIDRMEKHKLFVDHFTVSIMMKALKRIRNPGQHVGKALALMERWNIDVCSDEILLNTTLETCIRHREHKHLQSIIDAVLKKDFRASVHTYGTLIKGCGLLRRVPQCWAFWKEMELRGAEPGAVVVGCMLDALVCNSHVTEAVNLMEKMKAKVPPNTIMYSILAKGFNNTPPGKAIDAEALDKLLSSFRDSGLLNEWGLPLLERLRAKGVQLHGRCPSSFLKEGLSARNGVQKQQSQTPKQT